MAQASHNPPEGYAKANIDIEGFWSPKEGPIHGRLIGGFQFKNSKRRITTVYMIRITEQCHGTSKGINGGLVEATFEPGSVVGVFHSGDLYRLKTLYGCNVWIAPKLDENGEFLTKEVPQGEMKLFDLRYKGAKRELPIEHRNDDSAEEPKAGPIDYPDTEGDDDIPF